MVLVRSFAVSAVALWCAGGVMAQATPAPSAAALMRTALSDGNAQGSVHATEVETAASLRATLTDDVATHEGRQEITHSGGEKAHVLVVGGVAYLSGNQAALVHYFGFPAAVAREVGSRWVSIPSPSSGYSTVAAGATLASTIESLAIPGHVSETKPTTFGGQPVVGIHGNVPIQGSPHSTVAATLYVSRASRPLPVGEIYKYSNGGTATVTLSNWGESVKLSAPTNTIPESKLQK
jgi:hypothetical protein